MDGINFPMVLSNLNVSDNHPLWQTRSLKRSAVLNVNGTKIGFVGYLAPDTENMTKTHDISFSPEIDAVKYVNENHNAKQIWNKKIVIEKSANRKSGKL